jgi:hypothetical protein
MTLFGFFEVRQNDPNNQRRFNPFSQGNYEGG